MPKYYVDAGTTWSKILEISDEEESLLINRYSNYMKESNLSERFYILPSSMLSKLNIKFDYATGHMVKNMIKENGSYVNEIIALAQGANNISDQQDEITLIDLGSRDTKWIKFKKGQYKDLDWNNSCGSATGATVEMLCKFYNVDPNKIEPSTDKYAVTCGVFAMEKIMDDIASDICTESAVAKYIKGIAYNTWNFSQKPNEIYLSGGFCENSCFVKSLKQYSNVNILGRFVLLKGLYNESLAKL